MLIVSEWLTHNYEYDRVCRRAHGMQKAELCKKTQYVQAKKKLEQVPKNGKIKQTENISNLVYNLSKMGNEKIHNKCYGK